MKKQFAAAGVQNCARRELLPPQRIGNWLSRQVQMNSPSPLSDSGPRDCNGRKCGGGLQVLGRGHSRSDRERQETKITETKDHMFHEWALCPMSRVDGKWIRNDVPSSGF